MASVSRHGLLTHNSSQGRHFVGSGTGPPHTHPEDPPLPEGASGRAQGDLPEVVFPAGEGAALQGRAVGLHVAGVVELRLEGIADAHAACHEGRGGGPPRAQREPREAGRHGCGKEGTGSASQPTRLHLHIIKSNGTGDYTHVQTLTRIHT